MSEVQQNVPARNEYSEQEMIRREKLQGLMENGQNPYEITKFDVTHMTQEVIENHETLAETTVTMAGRMIGRHIMGKASFARLLDGDGKIQLYLKRDDIGEEVYAAFKKFDLGDLIGKQ